MFCSCCLVFNKDDFVKNIGQLLRTFGSKVEAKMHNGIKEAYFKKCKVMLIGKSSLFPSYTLGDTPLEVVNAHTDLAILVDDKLTFSEPFYLHFAGHLSIFFSSNF